MDHQVAVRFLFLNVVHFPFLSRKPKIKPNYLPPKMSKTKIQMETKTSCIHKLSNCKSVRSIYL